MAVYHQPYKNYLSRMARKLVIGFVLAIVAVILIQWVISEMDVEVGSIGAGIQLAVMFLLIALVVFIRDFYEVKGKKISIGIFGEAAIEKELLKLSNEFHIFKSLYFGYGDVDFTVVGPTGVFTIEVKAHKGRVTFDGQQLVRNNQPFQKNFLNQVWGEKKNLENYLSSSGIKINSVPILVFSEAWVKVGFGTCRGVNVIGKYLLLNIIHNQQPISIPIDKIVEKLNESYRKTFKK